MGEAPPPPARAPAPASCSRSPPASIAHLPASTLLHSPPLTYSTASTASYTCQPLLSCTPLHLPTLLHLLNHTHAGALYQQFCLHLWLQVPGTLQQIASTALPDADAEARVAGSRMEKEVVARA